MRQDEITLGRAHRLLRGGVVISRRTFLAMAALAARASADRVEVERERSGSFLRTRAINRGRTPVRVNDLIVFEQPLSLPQTSALYGEGFQMLTQTAGTMGVPVDLSQYTDAKHYRIPTGSDARAYYGLLTLTPPGSETQLFAFTSCARFSGRFEIAGDSVRAIVDCEGLSLGPGESWPLEELIVIRGTDRSAMLAEVADALTRNHPPLTSKSPPTGWCSWYCFGPNVTAQQVHDNLDVIARELPALKYVQIDDGYQRAMGDWLETGPAFGGSVRNVLGEIKLRGFQPAIWVAPFIAEQQSHLFQEHPDWFVKDADGAPLRSDRVTFGGWRHGPWYAIDGTHPDAQAHLELVFRTMRREWGCTYFKLDANFWGAIHGGRFHDPHATRIEAYRRGMQAIARGAGDGFLLGCNHPIWPSVGLIHGSRSSNDIKRSWDRVATTARQNLSRNWQNGRLWWNDPDAVVLAGDMTDAECQFHATAIYAAGGMVLSGDDLKSLPPPRAAMLRKLLPPTGVAAKFSEADLRVGIMTLPDATMICAFNWDDHAGQVVVDLDTGANQPASSLEPRARQTGARLVMDFWTGEAVPHDGHRVTLTLPPRSARLLRATA
jgi:alpha-galactosidase